MAKKTTRINARRSSTPKGAESAAQGGDEPAAAPEPQAEPGPDTGANVAQETQTGDVPASGGISLGALADRFISHLEEAGKGRSTVFSYSIDLALAVKHFGADTDASTLTERKVSAFFESDAVTQTRSGRPKAKPTVEKTRRVFRQAMVFACAEGMIAKAPIPKKYTPRGGSAKKNT